MISEPNVNACRACGAPIYWARNTVTNKLAPIDAEGSARGNIYLFRKGESREKLYRVFTGVEIEEARARDIPLHTNHFMTCPEAAKFKKEKR